MLEEGKREIHIDLEVTTKKTCKFDLNKFIYLSPDKLTTKYIVSIQEAFFSGIPLILLRRKLFSSLSYSKGLTKNPLFEVVSLHSPIGPNRIFIVYTLFTNHDNSVSVGIDAVIRFVNYD